MDVVSRLDELGIDITEPGLALGIGKFLDDYRASIIADLGLKPEFSDTLPNDGEYEYTTTSDCDGSDQAWLRRLPKLIAEPTAWEKTTEEKFLQAEYIED